MVAPLHQAAIHGAPVDVVETMIELGAWPSLSDSRGWLPVDLALLHGRSELAALLAPVEVGQHDSALFRVLTHRLGKLMADVMKEDSVPRFRTPQVAVIAEAGGEMDFDLTGSGHHFRVFLEEGELLVEHTSAGSDEGGIVYRVDGTGVVDTWEDDAADESAPAVDPGDDASPHPTEDPDQEWADAEVQATSGDPAERPEEDTSPEDSSEVQGSVEPTHSLTGVRTLWSELGDCALTVVPHEAVRRFNRERKRTRVAIVVLVSEFKKGRRWESVSAISPTEEVTEQSVAGKRWTHALVIEYDMQRDALKSYMRTVLEREAESGLGPEAHKDLLVAMERRSGADLARQVGELWKQIHSLAVSARLEPQRPNLPKPNNG